VQPLDIRPESGYNKRQALFEKPLAFFLGCVVVWRPASYGSEEARSARFGAKKKKPGARCALERKANTERSAKARNGALNSAFYKTSRTDRR